MPIYQFKCPECGHETENLMKHNESNPICWRCKHCVRTVAHGYAASKNVVMEKVFPTGTSFELKGDCWGKDGYKSKSKSKSKDKSKN